MSYVGGDSDFVAVGIDLEEDGSCNGFRIQGAPAVPLTADELASKAYVDSVAGGGGGGGPYLPLAGGTMAGPIDMGSGSISNGANAAFNSISTDQIGDKSGGNVGLASTVDANGFNVINAASMSSITFTNPATNVNPAKITFPASTNTLVIEGSTPGLTTLVADVNAQTVSVFGLLCNEISSTNATVNFGKTIDTGTFDVVTNGLECTTLQNPTAANAVVFGSPLELTNGGIDGGGFNIFDVGQVAATSVVSGGINANGGTITNVAAPVNGTDAANKTYVDTVAGGGGGGPYLPLAGGTMAGAIDMGSGSISNGDSAAFNSISTDQIGDKSGGNVGLASTVDADGFNLINAALISSVTYKSPTANTNDTVIAFPASTNRVVIQSSDQTRTVLLADTSSSGPYVSIPALSTSTIDSGLTSVTLAKPVAMGTNKITGLGTPTADADAATKLYVDTKYLRKHFYQLSWYVPTTAAMNQSAIAANSTTVQLTWSAAPTTTSPRNPVSGTWSQASPYITYAPGAGQSRYFMINFNVSFMLRTNITSQKRLAACLMYDGTPQNYATAAQYIPPSSGVPGLSTFSPMTASMSAILLWQSGKEVSWNYWSPDGFTSSDLAISHMNITICEI